MTQYIDKDALVTKIRKRLLPVIRDKHYDEWEEGQDSERKAILGIINTLEVKEVNLKKEIQSWVADNSVNSYYREDVYETAKHFFELGLKAQKGEKGMTTITEDYVSFETAKLLKEKRFDTPVWTRYEDGNEVIFGDKYNWNNSPMGQISAPTHQMTMKWLREVHNIMVSPYALSLGYYFEIFDLTNRNITGCTPLYQVGSPNKKEVLSTYEKACDAAIKYCLENLI